MDKHNKTFVMQQCVNRWLEDLAAGREPFFLYTHCPNPHLPYTPPRKYLERFTDDIAYSAEEALEFSLSVYADRDEMIRRIADGCQFTEDERDALVAMYDAEIAYADEFVGSLFDTVQRLDTGDIVFVVTGDHGDLFGEQGVLGHNLVLDDHLTNVPMVVHGLDGLDPVRDEVIQHADVTKTVAERLGVSHEQFSGVALREGPPEAAVSQRGIAHFDEYLEADPAFDTARYHEEPLTAYRTAEYKFLSSADRRELFELPDEETDVSDRYPDVADRLNERVEATLQDMHIRDASAGEAAYTDAMEQQLSDLGYL